MQSTQKMSAYLQAMLLQPDAPNWEPILTHIQPTNQAGVANEPHAGKQHRSEGDTFLSEGIQKLFIKLHFYRSSLPRNGAKLRGY